MAKIQSIDELCGEIGIATRQHDLERLQELEACFVATKKPGPLPLAPNIELNPQEVQVDPSAVESDQVLGLANAVSRAKRRIQYQREKWTNFRRPVIVSEGDSWFQYPVRLDDVIDVLMQDYLILSLGAAGDLVADMLAEGEYLRAIEQEDADILLLSGGGNDMVHSGQLAEYLTQYQSGMDAQAVVNRNRWNQFRDHLRSTFRSIFDSVVRRFPTVTIFCHGYDHALPRADGKWLGQPLIEREVPRDLWNDVIRLLIDEMNETLRQLATAYGGRVVHVDCRGSVGSTANSWFDELHPKDSGYKRVAKLFAEQIEKHARAGHGPTAERFTMPPAADRAALSVPAPEASLPRVVTGQFVQQIRDIELPSPLFEPATGDPTMLTEAIIQKRKSNVGPLLCPAPLPLDAKGGGGPGERPERTSAVVRAVIDSVIEHGQLPPAADSSAAADTAEPLTDQQLRDVAPCSSLAAWQAYMRRDPDTIQSYNDYVEVRRRFDEEESEDRIRTRRDLFPENDTFFRERIIGRSNLEQINFLARGERAARTVGRLSVFTEYGVPAGTGSGFLVGPGLLLTNNHVLPSVDRVRSNSYVLFDYEYDADNRLKTSERFDLTDELFLTDKELDFTFVSVANIGSRGSRIDEFGRMRLVRESGKALKGEAVSIIQHPEGLPKQIAIRQSTVVGRKGAFVYYFADTNPGSSGSPVVNDQWFPVALHHRSVPDYYRPCQYVANRGIRISEIYARLQHAADAGSEMAARIMARLEQVPRPADGVAVMAAAGNGVAIERLVEPYHELPYDNREGYDQDFLGKRVRMPLLKNVALIAAPRTDTSSPRYLLNYEHFSLVMHRQRRLAIFTAANVDASPEKKRPERDKSYSRKALGGLGSNDREKWFEDPRIASSHQLPDRFFEKDRTAFDKGHLTMCAEVAWGADYDEVRRANGDTFHTTNCSPQVADFNRAIFGFDGLWGQLEEIVLEEADDEKLCVFAGPIFDESDTPFSGVDKQGPVVVQIPSAYWKVIVARKGNGIETFAFVLQQDLSEVPFEFAVSGQWRERRISIDELEQRVRVLAFPAEMRENDGS